MLNQPAPVRLLWQGARELGYRTEFWQSSMSRSAYFSMQHPCVGAIKVRISNHPLLDHHAEKYGAPDIDVGPHSGVGWKEALA